MRIDFLIGFYNRFRSSNNTTFLRENPSYRNMVFRNEKLRSQIARSDIFGQRDINGIEDESGHVETLARFPAAATPLARNKRVDAFGA